METQATRPLSAPATDRLTATIDGLLGHWLLVLSVFLGGFAILPWLAPVFMHLGWEGPGRAIYTLYGLVCHQLPQRSWFLFGDHFTLPLAEIERAGKVSNDMFSLRSFIGNSEVGWKLAWSDRMVSFYGGWFVFALAYAVVRKRTKGLHWKAALLLLLPMAIDGVTHTVSDFWGMGRGFRETNEWLAVLSGHAMPVALYNGDAWGSFNSLMRLGTGLLAAYAVIFLLFPLIDRAVQQGGGQTTGKPTT